VVDVGVDTADRVDDVGEAGEVRVDDVVGIEAREHLLANRLDQQAVAPFAVGRVELLGSVTGNIHLEVTRDRQHVDRGRRRVEPQQQHRVGVRITSGRGTGAVIGADQQQRLGFSRLGRLDLLGDDPGVD
jgi:hypothetical protein